jgi:hypothetical protein
MATHLDRTPAAEPETASPQTAALQTPSSWRLTDALDAKLSELRDRGYEVLWIESSRADLTQLVMEGGEGAIRLDPDPAVDRAWYGQTEIRHGAARNLTWVFLRGEVAAGEVSAHVVGPPDAPG